MDGQQLSDCLLLDALGALSRRRACSLLAEMGSVRALAGALSAPPGHRERVASLERSGVQALTLTDESYPPLLREIPDPPPWLYLRGDAALLQQPMVALVGRRRASPAGLAAAADLASELVRSGLAVVSGLALGIDAAAHRGALAGAGRTLAVMATGPDRIYPRRHAGLAADILRGGCLLTEMPPGTRPLKALFPQRNRIISGLALATVVVEAALPSGSLRTASSALEQGRDVLALPWSVHHRGGAGCLQLLADGAGLVRGAADVLDAIGHPGAVAGSLAGAGSRPDEDPLSAALGDACLSLEALAARVGEDAAGLLPRLTRLELAGCIERHDGGYRRCHRAAAQPEPMLYRPGEGC